MLSIYILHRKDVEALVAVSGIESIIFHPSVETEIKDGNYYVKYTLYAGDKQDEIMTFNLISRTLNPCPPYKP
jgi:hypothetical protein